MGLVRFSETIISKSGIMPSRIHRHSFNLSLFSIFFGDLKQYRGPGVTAGRPPALLCPCQKFNQLFIAHFMGIVSSGLPGIVFDKQIVVLKAIRTYELFNS